MNPFKKNNHWLICQPELKEIVEAQWFEQDHWLHQGRLMGANSGRGSAWIIKSEHGKWILRHYFRGGLYAKISKDKYLWTGVDNCRAFKEFQLLSQLQQWQLPAPKAVAARVSKHGLFYRNDLLMEQIMHKQTFGQHLNQSMLEPTKSEGNTSEVESETEIKIWTYIGQTIAKFHNKGIYHSDLNANNILIAEELVYLIDFDKGDIRTPNIQCQSKNIARLKRSIEKITGKSCQHELKIMWKALHSGWQTHIK